MLIFERFQSADAAADEDAETAPVDFLQLDAGIAHRALRCGHRKMCEAVGALVIFWIVENRFRIEVADLASNAAIVAGGVEAADLDDPAAAFEKVVPEDFELVT